MPDIAAARLLVNDAFEFATELSEPTDVPRTVDTPVTTVGGAQFGFWQIDTGEADDVEVDEIFLVLAGAGRVTFVDGSTIELRPGVLVHLREGDQTTWVIDERLRKLYVATPS